MNINNKKKASALKRLFFLVSVIIAVISLILFMIDLLHGIISVGIFSIWYLYFHVVDYQFIEFSDDDNKILLRYFKAIKFGGGAYNSIEFPKHALMQANFENSVFGELTDLTIVVKTHRGPADYPSVSLTALPKVDRIKIKTVFDKLLGK